MVLVKQANGTGLPQSNPFCVPIVGFEKKQAVEAARP